MSLRYLREKLFQLLQQHSEDTVSDIFLLTPEDKSFLISYFSAIIKDIEDSNNSDLYCISLVTINRNKLASLLLAS